MMNREWVAGVVLVGASSLVLTGCTSTVQLPATELPTLSTQSVQRASEWPEVQTVNGERARIIGTIERIDIQGNAGAEPIHQPFAARVNGPYLEVMGPTGPRGFPLTQDLRVNVEYYDLKKKRSITGGALIAGGVLPFVGGVTLMAAGVDLARQNDGLGGLFTGTFGAFMIFTGAIGVAGGLGMMIPGIVFVASDPKKPVTNEARMIPRLQVGPSGVNLSGSF